jgi:hypothetical protein
MYQSDINAGGLLMPLFTSLRNLRPTLASALAALVLAASSAHAGPNGNAKILIHLARIDKVQPCTYLPLRPACEGIVTTATWGGGGFYHCPLLVTDGDAAAGLAGLSCGIDFPGDDLFIHFVSCAEGYTSYSGPNGPWPSPGSGILLDWDPQATGCQTYEPGGAGTGVVAIAGAFYITPYADSGGPSAVIAVTPHPQSGQATVMSCAGDIDVVETAGSPNSPYRLGSAGISLDGNTQGYNPCGQVVAVAPATWSTVKSLGRSGS